MLVHAQEERLPFLSLIQRIPSLPILRSPQHSLAGNGGLSRCMYFFVNCCVQPRETLGLAIRLGKPVTRLGELAGRLAERATRFTRLAERDARL